MTQLQQGTIDISHYRKNMLRVVYVTGDVAGDEESPVVRDPEDERGDQEAQTARRIRRSSSVRDNFSRTDRRDRV